MLAWILFSIYMIGTTYLGWIGFKKTKDFDSFAISSGDLHPFVVGITLAASVASAATFVINPGFVYVHGLAAFMHLGVSVGLGFCLMLAILSIRFRQIGETSHALTMPHWIAQRYQSQNLGVFFALVNLFALAFVVLIVGGLSIVMQQLLGLSNTASLILMLTFVTGYVFLGGTYAHVFTNTFQGSLMLIVTFVILGSGVHFFFENGGLFQQLSAIDSNLVKWINPASNLFNDIFSVYISGFLIGAALVCQPHILTKALYLKSDKAVKQYLFFGILIIAIFFLLPFAGFYARLSLPMTEIVDASGTFRQDMVMTMYIKSVFPGWLFTLISVVLLAAGMSTLDGILVSLSTITANDLLLPMIAKFKRSRLDRTAQLALAYRLSHVVLVVIALIAFVICLNPPKLLGIFGQVGVYGMAVAATPALLCGILFDNPRNGLIWLGALGGIIIHFTLYLWGETLFPNAGFTFANPGVTASLALLSATIPVLIAHIFLKRG
jgi:SSS family solute:Na+ symporter/sodium/pantothenate symporter